MTSIEQVLHNALLQTPEDWAMRFELLDKLKASGSKAEMAQVISEATTAPDSEGDLRKLSQFAVESGSPQSAEPILSAFVAHVPDSAVANYLLAKLLSRTGDLPRARQHYEVAVGLNSELEDDVLASKLADFGATLPQPIAQVEEAVAQALESEVEEPVQPAVVAPITPPAKVMVPAPLTPPPSSAAAARPAVQVPEVAHEPEEEPDSSYEGIPAVEADVAPPRLKPVPDLHETAAHMVTPEPFDAHAHVVEQDGSEVVEFEDHLHQTRHIVVAEGGTMIKAMEKTSDKNSKLSAVFVAVIAHVVLGLLFALVAMNLPDQTPPQIVASAAQVLDQDTMQSQEIQKQVQRKPVQSAQNQMEVISVAGASSVSMPDIQTDLVSFDPIGMGDAFGASMSFDAGEDGGMVSFFGSRSTSKKVVFAVDYSASMKAQDKDKLMRKELAKSVNALPGGIEYQLIFFHGPAWYHEQTFQSSKKEKWQNFIIKADRGNDEWLWYMGDNEDKRVPQGGKFNALFHPSWGMDPKDLPKGKYVSSTRSNIRKSIKIIEETPLGGGTDWRWPLYMAINMEPDTIFFMTDGAFGIPNKEKVIDEILRYAKSKGRPKINTINMMVLNAQTEDLMTKIAKETRGEFSLVLADQTVVRGKDLEDYKKKR